MAMPFASAAATPAGIGSDRRGRRLGAGFGLDLQGLAVDQGIGHLAAGRFDDAREGRSRRGVLPGAGDVTDVQPREVHES